MKWEYLVRHGDGEVWWQTEGNLFQAWVQWIEPKLRALKPEGEAVLRALDVLIAQEDDSGSELEKTNFDARALRNLRESRLAVGGIDRRREIARRLRELEDQTGEVGAFAERLEAGPWEA